MATFFQLAVIDMQMPGMDGETLGRKIKADPRLSGTRMIMLTSVEGREGAARFEKIGFIAPRARVAIVWFTTGPAAAEFGQRARVGNSGCSLHWDW